MGRISPPGHAGRGPPGWRFEIGDRDLRLISQWSPADKPAPLLLNFDPERCHVTLLGLMNDGRLGPAAGRPAPSESRLVAHHHDRQGAGLAGFDASRGQPWLRPQTNFVKITFPAATQSQPRLEYRCESHGDLSAVGQAGKGPGAARLSAQLAEHPPIGSAAADAGQQFHQRRLRVLHVRVRRHGGPHAALGRSASPRSTWCARRSTGT